MSDLAFGFVITQFTAHQMIGVKSGLVHHRSRVAHLLKFTNTWFNYSALIFVFSVSGVGYWFFSGMQLLPSAEWLIPWFVLVISTALNLRYSTHLVIVEGSGEVGQVGSATVNLKFYW